MNYESILRNIAETDSEAYRKAKVRLDILAKPPGSLGLLEEMAARLCGIFSEASPDIGKRCVLVMASDNGVVAEGVSSAPQSVTAAQTLNILNGVAGVSVIAKRFNTDVFVADVGINADINHPNLINRKIRKSTGNITKEAAMTAEETAKAIETGIELVETAKQQGYTAIGVGEMGIGNTTSASAVLAALLGLDPLEVPKITGRGAGLENDAYIRKTVSIEAALALHKPLRTDPADILQKVGGLDICAMAGAFIGAAHCRLPAVIDGFISAVAALCAVRMNPIIKEYLFASHHSAEKGHASAIGALELPPCLYLGMRLGEGSGCPLMFGVMDAALAVLNDMATFCEAQIDPEYTRKTDSITF